MDDEFKAKYNKMIWHDIIAVRNRAVHAYETTDIRILWKIATDDVLDLKKYCENIIEETEI